MKFNQALLKKILLVLILPLLAIEYGQAQSTGTQAHDPVMAKEDGTYYLFYTGEGIQIKSSPDMENWEHRGQVFDSAPEWTLDVVPEFENVMWAPDIAEHNGTYYLYYSVSQFGRNSSAIGVVTNQTLDPDAPDYEWEDQGKVIQSVPGRDMWNAIDPNMAFDDEGTPWLAFGSFWMGVKIVKMEDNLTEIARRPQEWHTIAERHRYWKLDERDAGDAANPELNYDSLYTDQILEKARNTEFGAVEAPFIFKQNGYYYLFISWDRCCRGTESTYKIMVGRSKEITGPYLDRKGKDLKHGGGTLVADGNEEWAAVGHPAAYTFDGTDYLVFHGYDSNDDGKAKLWISDIQWQDGWPTISLD